ncbi:hypothetical protein BO443_250004 [Burkholderia orbicola]
MRDKDLMFALDLVKKSNKINGALFTNYHLLQMPA